MCSAQTSFEQVLAGRRMLMGEFHEDTLWALNNCAMCHADLGEYSIATEGHHVVLQHRTLELGATHPHTLLSKSNLGAVFLQKGEQLHAQGSEMWEEDEAAGEAKLYEACFTPPMNLH